MPRIRFTFVAQSNGTGGRMATEAKAAGTKRNNAGKAKATSRKKESKARTTQPEDMEGSEPGTGENTSLREEALIVAGSQSSSVVERLMVQVMRGDAKSTQMLAKLAKKEAEAKQALKHGPLRSQALAFAAEPQWQDEMNEEKAESSGGSQEAE